MSRGLGFMERLILKHLRKASHSKIDFTDLMWTLAGHIEFVGDDYDLDDEDVSRNTPKKVYPSDYKSALRALKSLERKGFLKTRKERYWGLGESRYLRLFVELI
jgi:hypothetical protein